MRASAIHVNIYLQKRGPGKGKVGGGGDEGDRMRSYTSSARQLFSPPLYYNRASNAMRKFACSRRGHCKGLRIRTYISATFAVHAAQSPATR